MNIDFNIQNSENDNLTFDVITDNNKINFNVEGDKYYIDLAKEWAISEKKVQNIDYSSKYYAAQSAKNTADSKKYVETVTNAVEQGVQAALNAQTYSNNAQISALNAATSENNAQNYLTETKSLADLTSANAENAANSASNALTSETAAKTSENNALTYSSDALSSATSASDSAALSAENKNNAQIWAEGTDEQIQLIGGIHSAKEWAAISSSGQIQSDWNETDISQKSYIQNKPDLTIYATNQILTNQLAEKQNNLTAGNNIQIQNDIISATDAEWGNIQGNISEQKDLQNNLNSKLNTDLSNLTTQGLSKIYFWAPFCLNEVADGSKYALKTINKIDNTLYYKRNVKEIKSPVYDNGNVTSGSIATILPSTWTNLPMVINIRIKTAAAFTKAVFMTSSYSPWSISVNANGTMTFSSVNSSGSGVGVTSANVLPVDSEVDILMTLNSGRNFNLKYKLASAVEYTDLFTWNGYATGAGPQFVFYADEKIVQYIDLEHTFAQNEWYAIIDGTSSDYDYLIDCSIFTGIICKPCTITTAGGVSKTFYTSKFIDASAAPKNGTYFIMKSITTGELSFSSVYDWKFLLMTGSSYSQDTLYLDRSGAQWKVKRRINSDWIEDEDMSNKVPLGYAAILTNSNQELYIKNFWAFPFNRFAYLLNKAPTVMYSYSGSSFGYRVWSDLYFEAWGYVAATATNYDDIKITLPGGLYADNAEFNITLTYETKNTTSALQGKAYGYHDRGFSYFYIYMPSSTYVSGVQWKASGYMADSSPQRYFYDMS